ncbi:hypothetical protein AB0I81_36905 [Nonomuraea sp. NPDC050404]|uniref:hypothetical protein n=1 Tax=Nonomuraea sp. NPDC050404 TaxID=3155783 RepID=UPI0034064398
MCRAIERLIGPYTGRWQEPDSRPAAAPPPVDKGLEREAAFFGVLMSVQGAGSIAGGLTAAPVLLLICAAALMAKAGYLRSGTGTFDQSMSEPK